ncbi:hypothetical protein Tsubulata_022176 [Turnera subulata]|uniref:Uncharacterized protein n=1 Tax=Turnera subulata TaxID=218843 RepID=A0A9Q0F5X8_9ROSI|nr:hypothetical protein Tsubulata_022176 [Turnera subulata]
MSTGPGLESLVDRMLFARVSILLLPFYSPKFLVFKLLLLYNNFLNVKELYF